MPKLDENTKKAKLFDLLVACIKSGDNEVSVDYSNLGGYLGEQDVKPTAYQKRVERLMKGHNLRYKGYNATREKGEEKEEKQEEGGNSTEEPTKKRKKDSDEDTDGEDGRGIKHKQPKVEDGGEGEIEVD